MSFRDIARAIAITLGSVCGSISWAQVPADIAVQNRALGARIDVSSAIQTYKAVEEQPPYKESNVHITRDLSYGEDAHNRLDIFAPAKAGRHPVVIFATGGDFTRKIDLPGGEPFYDNVVLWAAKHGYVGINMERRHFRNVPQWQAGPEDMKAMIGWVHQHIAEYGGDPTRVVFLGHAYGGTQLVSYLAHPEYWCCGSADPGIIGAVLISAPLNLAPLVRPAAPPSVPAGVDPPSAQSPRPPGRGPAAGANPLMDPNHSDLDGLTNIKLPVLSGAPEWDGEQQQQSRTLVKERLCAQGNCPTELIFRNHNHLSVMFSFNTTDDSVSGPVLQWMKTLSAKKQR